MPRIDYDELKDKFERVVKTFKAGSIHDIEGFLSKDIKSFFSIKPSDFVPLGYADIENFIETFPKTEELHLPIYNYVCKFNNYEAQTYGQVVAIATTNNKEKNTLEFLHFVIMLSLHFKKEDDWILDEFKLDFHPINGDLLHHFKKHWYISYPLADYEKDTNIPVIQGEFDSPWIKIDSPEDILSGKEKIQECVAKRFYGIDHFVVDHVIEAYASKLNTNSGRYGKNEGIRELIAGLRFKRQKDRYWTHPWRLEKIKIEGDYASALTYRVAGYIQRNHEYVWNKSNRNKEHVCQECIMEFIQENGEWRIVYNDITLGLYELNDYDDEHLFRDNIS